MGKIPSHTISREFFDTLKPWSNHFLNPEKQDIILLVPSLDDLALVPYELLDTRGDTIMLHQMRECPRGIMDLEAAKILFELLVNKGYSPLNPPQYVNTIH